VDKMSKYKMLIPLEKNIELFAGDVVAKKIMEGSEALTEKTDKKKIAEWVKSAMERMDSLVDEKTRVQIMENCGYNCAIVNKKVIDRAKARRMKCKTVNEFLEAEERKPSSGTRLVREEKLLHYFYTPKKFSRPMRCYCSLLRALPEEKTVSSTYCNCAKGFVKKYWESVLGKSVQVQLKQSAVTGAEDCEFIIQY
jgi:hypothetical protein